MSKVESRTCERSMTEAYPENEVEKKLIEWFQESAVRYLRTNTVSLSCYS